MKNFALVLTLMLSLNYASFAVEGMWIPSLIEMFHSDMKTYGLKLSPEQVYSTNQSSLKDAIVQFNGGCTAEIVSEEGLLFTNHHCGFSAIQHHSSVEKDYLKNGFWAKNKSEELKCTWMYVTFVKEIRDVTADVFKGSEGLSASERSKVILNNINKLQKEAESGPNVTAVIKDFNMGNQFFMLVTQDYNDIRMVGAPPSAIGKYGGDTDNWVWPRHTGDFAVFRIYADKDNNPAKYNENNQPFKPAHSLPISLKPKKEGDFTMVYGFPGSTDQHFCSEKLDFYMSKERPARIKMRETSLDIITPAMNKSDEIRIQYASKQARIANAWKKWIGQIGGLNELHAIDKKKAWEKEYIKMANSKAEFNKYKDILPALNKLAEENSHYEFARSVFIEYFFVGPEFFRQARDINSFVDNYEDLKKEGKAEEEVKKLINGLNGYFKNYNKDIDRDIFNAMTPMFIDYVGDELLPNGFKENWKKNGEKIFSKSLMVDKDKLIAALEGYTEKSSKKFKKDPAFMMAAQLYNMFLTDINPKYATYSQNEQGLMKGYVEGVLTMFPDKKTWADANSTMRIAYGKVEGSAPVDGMKYLHYSTVKGIMQKYDPNHPDFQLPQRFIDLYEKGNWGDYQQDGEMWVCFTASNHTTGGNSGSPVLDADGNLMGINFDRSWESTMSDFMFDESRCRNIVVDARYVLWVIDKYGDAGWLIEEMKLVK